MSKEKWALVLLALAVAAIVAFKYIAGMGRQAIDSNASRMEGPAGARVQIVEFVDFQCPSCAAGYKMLKAIRSSHPNDLRVQLKYFPLYKVHSHAKQATLYGECAARQGKFWPFIDKVFERQQQWAPMLNIDSAFHDMAKESGLDLSALNACLVSEATLGAIEGDRELGTTLAVSSTPTFFINNKMVVGTKSLGDELKTYFPESK